MMDIIMNEYNDFKKSITDDYGEYILIIGNIVFTILYLNIIYMAAFNVSNKDINIINPILFILLIIVYYYIHNTITKKCKKWEEIEN